MTEALNTSIGAHPTTHSESFQSHWKSITSSALTGRTIELSTVAQTSKVEDTFTPLFDQGSFMDRAGSFARRFAKPALATGGATAAIAGAAIVVDLDGNYASAQEPSAEPSANPSPEASPSLTPDPLTGLLPCPTEPEESPEPTDPSRTLPPDIGVVSGEALAQTGTDIFVSAEAQAAPSSAPSGALEASPAASATPNPETAVNCDPVLTEAYIKAGKPADKEQVKFSFMDEAVEAPLSIGELKGIINSFYAKNPKALNYVDEYDTKLTPKLRNKLLKYCQKGYPGDPKPVIEQSKALGCASLIRYFYFIARENKSQGMMDLAQSVYWYALANLKSENPESAVGEFLADIEIKKEVIQG